MVITFPFSYLKLQVSPNIFCRETILLDVKRRIIFFEITCICIRMVTKMLFCLHFRLQNVVPLFPISRSSLREYCKCSFFFYSFYFCFCYIQLCKFCLWWYAFDITCGSRDERCVNNNYIFSSIIHFYHCQ